MLLHNSQPSCCCCRCCCNRLRKRRLNGQMDGRMDRSTDGRTDRRMAAVAAASVKAGSKQQPTQRASERATVSAGSCRHSLMLVAASRYIRPSVPRKLRRLNRLPWQRARHLRRDRAATYSARQRVHIDPRPHTTHDHVGGRVPAFFVVGLRPPRALRT